MKDKLIHREDVLLKKVSLSFIELKHLYAWHINVGWMVDKSHRFRIYLNGFNCKEGDLNQGV